MIDLREFNPFTGPRRFAERFKDLWDNAVRRDGLAHGPHLLIRELDDGRVWLDALVDERPDDEVVSPLAIFRVVSSTQDGTNNRWVYTCKLQTKSTDGYDGWADSTADTADYTLYALFEVDESTTEAVANGSRIAAMQVTSASGSVEWWIVGAGGGGLPKGAGQYKVLQLDANDQPIWDYVRAHA